MNQILHEELRKGKICTKFAPHSLTDEQKQQRLTSCQDFIQTYQDNPSFLDCIVTGDGVMGISICPRDETSEHAMDLKVIKAQKVSFAKVQDQNHADHIFLINRV
jgi:hypothetical protein